MEKSEAGTTSTSQSPPQASERSPGSTKRYFHQVPLPLTSLVGRKHEIQEALTRLRNPEVRLLTITGPGGVGKSHLALQVAADAQQDFADGYCSVELAHCTTLEEVELSIAQALGLRVSEKGQPKQHLQTFLRDKHLLFLLDNFEQVQAATPLLLELLWACPLLKILVTSRAALRVQGEFEFLVPPLSVPDLQHLPLPESLVQYDAVALFAQRAQAISGNFRVTEENAKDIAVICVRLDGLPLAIELAAARTRMFSPRQLLARLEKPLDVLTQEGPDLPRHHALRATMAWSYELLTVEEQHAFRCLSVFAGGCTLEAAEAVCAAVGEVSRSVLDMLEDLLDQSLLHRVNQEGEEPRLRMLQTIREYGLEKLESSVEVERARHAHATYFLALAERAEPFLSQGTWLKRLEQEHENLSAALRWLLERRELEEALRLAGALRQFWFFRGFQYEGRGFLERAIAAMREDNVSVPLWVRVKALYAAASLAHTQGDFEHANMLLQESLELCRRQGDIRGEAAALRLLGVIADSLGSEYEVGDAFFEESARLYREVGDEEGAARILFTLGWRALLIGEFARAQELCKGCLSTFRVLDDRLHIAISLHLLGWASYCQGAYAAARRLSEESVAHFRALRNPAYTVEALTILAYEAAALKEESAAASLLEEAFALAKRGEKSEDTACVLCGLGHLALHQGEMAQAWARYRESLAALIDERTAARLTLRTNWIPAMCLEGLGQIALSQGQAALTTLLLGAAEVLRRSGTYSNPLGIEQPSYGETLATARAQLGEETFTAYWAVGRAMTPGEVLAALEALSGSQQGKARAPGQRLSTSAPAPASRGLTPRELEVLRLLADGLPYQQIAEQLGISPRTVNIHVSSIYKKLEITTRAAATRYAIDHGLG